MLIGRLAIDTKFQGQKLGRKLVLDAMNNVCRNKVASFALTVDAKDGNAKNFYKKYDFVECYGNTNKLILPMSAIRELLVSTGAVVTPVFCEMQEMFLIEV